MGKLDGRCVIITGASSGIGVGVAKLFVNEGASVGLIARRKDIVEDLAKSLGSAAIALPADVSDDVAIDQAVSRFAARFGGVDICVNAAGVFDRPTSIGELTAAAWRNQIEVNLNGSFFTARACVKHMPPEGGQIINFGSELGLVGMGHYSHYCAAKFGVIGMTKALAAELAPRIRVNCICPGPVDTPMMEAELACFDDPERARREAIERVPLKRFASVEEIAKAVLYFAADATYATGSIYSIDGGTTTV